MLKALNSIGKKSSPTFGVSKLLHHIAAVVKDLDETVGILSQIFSVKEISRKNYGVMEVLMLQVENIVLELISPSSSSSTYWEFLEKGGGIHHIAFKRNDRDELLKKLDEMCLDYIVTEVDNFVLVNVKPEKISSVNIQFIIEKQK